MLFRFLVLVHVCAAFPLKCPEPAQWSLRASSHCPDPSKYFCLRNDLINGYSENCTVFDFLRPGRKHVLRGGLDADICLSQRYQPWPITFYTNVSTNCIFGKSECNEEGQVVNDNGNQTTDSTCRCDYTKGYDFLSKPRNRCFCIPSEEDCSCFIKSCSDSTFKLSPDYKCIHSRMNISTSQCIPLMTGRDNRVKNQSHTEYITRKENISTPVLWKHFSAISTLITLIACVGLVLVAVINGLLNKYYRSAYFTYQPHEKLQVVAGQSITLTYKLLIDRFDVDCFKNDDVIRSDSNVMITKADRSTILRFNKVALNDTGVYYVKTTGNTSSIPTHLTVKPLFKRQLADVTILEGYPTIFECESEEDDSPVAWFKDNINITHDNENLKIETLAGHKYKLSIAHTTLQAKGIYRIQKNGIFSEAFLDVKELFKRHLSDVTILEGFATIFDCATEKDDSPVEWFKDGVKIHHYINNIKMETLAGHTYKLTIAHTTLQDKGRYRMKKKGSFSEAILEVKAMFKQPLQDVTIMEGLDTIFKCATEKEDSLVEWFKDGDIVNHSNENIKLDSLSENIYKLTIKNTNLQDSGIYSIKKNGISSTAELYVKEMPETIKQMSVNDREEFLKAAKSGTNRRYYIRVMIIGENSVGKTCLLRRLMNEPIDDVISTVGIDIERRKCQVDVNTGKWHFRSIAMVDEEYYSSWSSQSEEFADCGFWDFAGQKEFYATHQTFLSANAVYLLVVDISKDFTQKTYYKMIEDEFDYIGEYIDFWLDNIHCYSTDDHNESSEFNANMDLNPPVVIVCTGIDRIPLVERKEIQQKFQDHLSTMLSVHAKRRHLRKAHFLSNTHPSTTRDEFKNLRKKIFENARGLKSWGDILPARWIVLEKEIHRKITKEKKFIMSYNEAKILATTCTFPDVTLTELDSFLKYEHDIGNIIFFEDVKEFIILDHKWLVDVFKCFVSNQYRNDLIQMTEWSDLAERGKLLNNLIRKLLETDSTLMEYRHFILQIMEKFDIIVRPINVKKPDGFYMPCMIKPVKLETIIKEFSDANCTKTSWFFLEFDFLPPSYFNHILVSFVKEKKLCTKKDHQLCIYRNIGLFYINGQHTQVLIVCLLKNCIAMQVWQWDGKHGCYTAIIDNLIDLVHSIQQRYRINISFKKKFKCADGICSAKEGRVDYDTVCRSMQYLCLEHKKIHSSNMIYNHWLTDKDIEEYKKKDYRKCNDCEQISVRKCFDCSKYLCIDCYIKDNEKNPTHLMQPSSNSYMLNCKYRIGREWIRNIKCLSNGFLIALTNVRGKEIMTFSINGKQKDFHSLNRNPFMLAVVDRNTVSVSAYSECCNFTSVVKADLHRRDDNHNTCTIKTIYKRDPRSPLIYVENQLYIAVDSDIIVTDMLGTTERRINLGFTPYDMCYDVYLQRIYCIDKNHRKLYCIDRSGHNKFTYLHTNMEYPHSLTIDKDENVLVLCTNKNDNSCSVVKVDYRGEASEVVITNIPESNSSSDYCICFHRLTNSVIIAVEDTIYIYKKEANVDI